MAKRKRIVKTSRLFWTLLRITLGKILIKRFKAGAENIEQIRELKPPYFLLPNHVGFWDPFLVAAFLHYPVHYVVSRFQFDKPLTRILLSLIGGIPKAKKVSDFETVRTIMDLKKKGGIIGIYPEGSRTWDGVTLPIIRSTAKLVKLLKIPVVCPLQKGGFFTQPRWAHKAGRGKITIDYQLLFRGPELAAMSAGEIADKIQEAINYDEYAWHQERDIVFRNRRSAEYIEQTLFACSECGSINSLHSEGDSFFCSGCGTRFRYNPKCFIEGGQFSKLTDWNRWQLDRLTGIITMAENRDPDQVLFRSDNVVSVCERAEEEKKKRQKCRGSLCFLADRLIFIHKGRTIYSLALSNIFGHNVQNREDLEFYSDDRRFLIHDRRRRFPGYLWMNAIEIYQKTRG
ncbi:MAG: 1-acyl-sn-glycerol-3-phosphate acyltransferase [Spirochaetales bacterium]|nr:1-acyl-sn-glycerol-3-phosphate acyltransferase [Spirochaetales bacterium]